MKRRIFIVALLICMVLGLCLTAQAQSLYDEVKEPAINGNYYLCATVDGVDYYYRVTNSSKSESVTDTFPYSLYVTDDPDDKNIKEFTLGEVGSAFYLGYPSGQDIHKIYAFDVDKDDIVDTGLNSGLDLNRHGFYWDGPKNLIFAMRNDEKYVLVVKTLKNLKTGIDEPHMLCVPASDLEGEEPVYPVRFVAKHSHKFSDTLTSNAYSHWFECDCGEKTELQLHQVENWTVTKEPAVGEGGSRTGVCSVCGATAEERIPALKDRTTAPTETADGTQPTEDQAQETAIGKMDPVVIVVASALVVLGLVILIFGKKREKK